MNIATDVLAVLSTALRIEENRVQIIQQLDRKTYQKVNAVLEACGGTWNRKVRAHVFVMIDPAEAIEQALALGTVQVASADLAFFATPPELAARLAHEAGNLTGATVLEPSAGRGALVRAALDAGASEVFCVERDPKMRQGLRDAFPDRVFVSDRDDFMEYAGDMCSPDAVLMNPPFKRIGLGDHLDHVRHAFLLLRPGGVLVAVLPSGVEFREDRRHREFREWVAGRRGSITPLPEGSFKASGTGVNTVLVRVEARS